MLAITPSGRPGTRIREGCVLNGNGTSELKVTYPQSLSVGVSYQILKFLRAEASGEVTLRQYRDLDGREDDYNLGYRAGGSLEWTIIPKIKLSAGYLYNNFGIKPAKRNEADPLLESHTVGGGFGIAAGYPVARALQRSRRDGRLSEHFALIRESHCRGFGQGPTMTVHQWIAGQGAREGLDAESLGRWILGLPTKA